MVSCYNFNMKYPFITLSPFKPLKEPVILPILLNVNPGSSIAGSGDHAGAGVERHQRQDPVRQHVIKVNFRCRHGNKRLPTIGIW